MATISQGTRGDYVRAARILGRRNVDVVLLEHEYGIFGGRDGEYILSLAEELTQPLVVTLHTVLSHPTAHQARVLETLCGHAELVIVMTERLCACSSTTEPAPRRRSASSRTALRLCWSSERPRARRPRGRAGRLRRPVRPVDLRSALARARAIENVLRALPAIIEEHPEVLYVVAGRTHPGVAQREGERYRLSLQQLVAELGLEEHVEFDDRFLAIDEIADLLAMTSVFVTPYLDPDQTSSGALTFAIAAGCAVVSTPYRYAEDMLASGAGELVPFADPGAVSAAVCRLIDNPALLERGSRRGAAHRSSRELAVGRKSQPPRCCTTRWSSHRAADPSSASSRSPRASGTTTS